MIIFEGYEEWFESYTVTPKGRYVVFHTLDTLSFNIVEEVEDTFDITFVSCIGGKCLVFRIDYKG